MLKTIFLNAVFVFLFLSVSFAKSDIVELRDTAIIKIESKVILGQFDSASYLISLENPTPYLSRLKRIVSKENTNYDDYSTFINRIVKQDNFPYDVVSSFITENVAEPTDEKTINLDFVKLKWNQISKLRDEVDIDEASREQIKLDKYINRFDTNDVAVRKAKIISSTHQIVLYIIQKEVDKGKELCLDNLEEAKRLDDKNLMIISLYYYCDFLIFEGKLDDYINTCEEALKIENTLQNKSSYYAGTLIHTIDAYIYKEGNNERVDELLAELYGDSGSRAQSYSLYAKYLGILDLNSEEAKSIFKQYEVANLVEYCLKIEKLGSVVLNPNDLYQLYREISNTLQIHEYLTEAIDFKDRTVVLIKKIYSQDLANSLADYKTNMAVKEKDIEIEHQNERNKLYIIIGSLIAGLLFISVFALIRKRKQSRVLELKNKQIEITLKEKELLVREVHHRVKNNFQIVSSLLELQTRGIDDEKALMLANEGRNRVRSMALIHQKLYQAEDGLIDFEAYVRLLVKELTALYVSSVQVETKVIADKMHFDVDTAIPLGLIINELITNAYKYAFADTKLGRLTISIERETDEAFKLTVADNGPGLSTDYSVKRAKSLGLRLVSRLVKQLHGKLSLNNDNGARFEISFKDIAARRKID